MDRVELDEATWANGRCVCVWLHQRAKKGRKKAHSLLVSVPVCSSLCLRRSKVRSHQAIKIRGNKTVINDDDLSIREDGEAIDHIDQLRLVTHSHQWGSAALAWKCKCPLITVCQGRMGRIKVDKETNRK